MSSIALYQAISKVYDLLDITYFRNKAHSPRKAVLERIGDEDHVLDLCTGTATNAINIAKAKPSTEITGIDLSDKMLEVGKAKVKKALLPNVSLKQMDATALEFKAASFDTVLISLVLHELDEELTGRLILEAKRVLKDNGRIIVTEWEKPEKSLRRALFAPVALLEPKPYRSFIKKDMYKFFAAFGLRVEEYVHCDYSRVMVLSKGEAEPYLEATQMVDYADASLQKKFPECTGSFCEYGVGVKDFRAPVIDWNGNDTYIQIEGINQDFGVYNNPDEMLLEHHQETGAVKGFIYRHLGRHLMNRNVRKIRG